MKLLANLLRRLWYGPDLIITNWSAPERRWMSIWSERTRTYE
jgi:hypothetical protein